MIDKIALGTWLMGGTKDPDPANDDAYDISIIRLAIDSGVTLIDTAQNYAAGRCEELVGEAVASCPRSSYKILTKQAKEQLDYKGVIEGCKRSLERLNLDYLDYFVCHAPNAAFDMREFFRAANKLADKGLIKNVGVSNFGPAMLKIAVESSALPISLNQVSFSLYDDSILRTGTYAYCVENGIPIQSYRTLVTLGENPEIMSELVKIAKNYEATPHQIALAFLNSYENIHFTLRASSKVHWEEVMAAMEIKLAPSEVEILSKLQANHPGRFEDFLKVV